MEYIECPEMYEGDEKSLFLAGGISNCLPWQADLVNLLKGTNIVLLNPRRRYFQSDNPSIEEEQIAWECNHLIKAKAVSFWFPSQTVCPITLYELGKMIGSDKQIFIGVHPGYKRRKDIEIQTRIIKPGIKIVYSLKELAEQIKNWAGDE